MMKPAVGLFSSFLLAICLGLLSPIAVAVEFEKKLVPFFDRHCYECHDDVTAKGDLDLFSLGEDLSDPAVMERWLRIFDQVEQGIMPPEKKPRPESKEREGFLDVLAMGLSEAHAAQKGTVLRRLNRTEYENTLNDVFGTNLNLALTLPEDGLSHGFDNVGESLSLSMVQLERYMKAMDRVLDAAIEKYPKPGEPKQISARYADSKGEEKHYKDKWLKLPDGSTVFFQATGYPDGSLREASVRESGRYKIRVTGYAYQSETPQTFMLQARTYKRGAEQPTLGYFEMAPGKPTTVETEAWIDGGYRLAVQPMELHPDTREFRESSPREWKGPGLAIDRIEIEGPLVEEFPSRGHRLIFDGLERREVEPSNPQQKTKSWYVPQYEIVSENPSADAGTVLRRVATRAFRRPATEEQVAPYLDLFSSEMAQGANFETALRTAIIAIFCAPDFLYLREQEGWLDSWELASRLSYFLTRTAPDEELLAVAATGKLAKDPAALVAQVDRLLADPRASRFVSDFTDAWLDLRNIEFTAPDQRLFPEFDPYLQASMVDETRAYFRELIDRNLPVTQVVKSDFAMLNERTAAHYGIDGVDGPEIRRVSLPADSVRGGFLGQGSILKVSANGTNTSPVLRGVWVLERIMGTTPPPPPPSVPGVEPDIRGAETLRQTLEKHRSMESCVGCHQLIDPPGFALESFNPVGGWRENYRTLGGDFPKAETVEKGRRVNYRVGLPVDASGEVSDYGEFAGFREFRDLLANDEARLTRTLVTKLLIFSTGREMGFSDRAEIGRLVAEATEKKQGIHDLIHAVVTSQIFRQK